MLILGASWTQAAPTGRSSKVAVTVSAATKQLCCTIVGSNVGRQLKQQASRIKHRTHLNSSVANQTRETSGRKLRAFKDALFAAVFARTLVYTILFEDNELDLKFLDLRQGDSVFSVAGAGCGVAAMIGYGPSRIDTVDFNQHHLAITALKVEAVRSLPRYDDLHALFGLGRHPEAKSIVGRLVSDLPANLAGYWRRRWRMFARGFYRHGVNSRNSALLRPLWSIDGDYLKELNRRGPPQERAEAMRAKLTAKLLKPLPATLVRSPVALLGAGINYTQRERNLRAAGVGDVVLGVIEYASRLATTDLDTNWIAWHITTGEFNHEDPDCLPLYLRPDSHERALGSGTQVGYHHGSLLAVLEEADSGTWSHYCLSDVVDWLSAEQRRELLREVLRTAKPGARVICRTVEDACVVADAGLSASFRLVEPISSVASESERSKLYRRVNCYEVIR